MEMQSTTNHHHRPAKDINNNNNNPTPKKTPTLMDSKNSELSLVDKNASSFAERSNNETGAEEEEVSPMLVRTSSGESQTSLQSQQRRFFMKWSVIFLLIIQTTGHGLLLRYSTTVKLEPNQHRFVASCAIISAEMLKLVMSLIAYFVLAPANEVGRPTVENGDFNKVVVDRDAIEQQNGHAENNNNDNHNNDDDHNQELESRDEESAGRSRRHLRGQVNEVTKRKPALPPPPAIHRSIEQRVCKLVDELYSPSMRLLAIPGFLFLLQTQLIYVAVSNLELAIFQITSLTKILTTALFSVLMLKRRLSLGQVIALVVLVAGVALVQLPTPTQQIKPLQQQLNYFQLYRVRLRQERAASNSSAASGRKANPALGVAATLAASVTSGFANVWLERFLKSDAHPQSIALRNVQLSLYGLFFGVLILIFQGNDLEEVSREGFFTGFTPTVWAAIAFQSLGGILVAMSMKHADNILKGFATSVSVVCSAILSSWLFNDTALDAELFLGMLLISVAIYLYSKC